MPRQVERALGEIDTGVRECYGDVRELLVHFRTRANAEDIEPALQTTLRKFEHQSGLKTAMQMQGHGMPLAPDLQVQVLHIVQEALSNVRKHARATQVWLDVQQQPQWRFEVRDDGVGFVAGDGPPDETHVGCASWPSARNASAPALDVLSTPGRGTSIVLTLPPALPAIAADELAAADSRGAALTAMRCRCHAADSHPRRRRPHAVPARPHRAAGARSAVRSRRRRGRRRRGPAPRAGIAARPDPARQPSAGRQRRGRAAGAARGGAGGAHPDAHGQRGRAGSRRGAARRRVRLPAEDDGRRRARQGHRARHARRVGRGRRNDRASSSPPIATRRPYAAQADPAAAARRSRSSRRASRKSCAASRAERATRKSPANSASPRPRSRSMCSTCCASSTWPRACRPRLSHPSTGSLDLAQTRRILPSH